jgi:hypothetical protein
MYFTEKTKVNKKGFPVKEVLFWFAQYAYVIG